MLVEAALSVYPTVHYFAVRRTYLQSPPNSPPPGSVPLTGKGKQKKKHEGESSRRYRGKDPNKANKTYEREAQNSQRHTGRENLQKKKNSRRFHCLFPWLILSLSLSLYRITTKIRRIRITKSTAMQISLPLSLVESSSLPTFFIAPSRRCCTRVMPRSMSSKM